MNITLKTEYALRALYEVMSCGNGKPVTRKQISNSQGISEHFLEKIFINLQKSKIIKSVRGPGGGFVLERKPENISLWDVYTAVDDPGFSQERCYHKQSENCILEMDCKIKNIWYKFGENLKNSMTGITLVEILEK